METQIQPLDDFEMLDMPEETALATVPAQALDAQKDYALDWLYQTSSRISIDDKTRRGFIVKDTDRLIERLECGILGARSYHVHKNSDRYPEKHTDTQEWCESDNGKQTSTRGQDCARCPAFTACKWKIELQIHTMDETQEISEYLLSLPTVSAIRFKNAVGKLKRAGYKIEQVPWVLTLSVEENKNKELFPVVNFHVFVEGQDVLAPKAQPVIDVGVTGPGVQVKSKTGRNGNGNK